MPFTAFENYRAVERLRDIRRSKAAGYSIALMVFAAAAALRFGANNYISEGLPFITFYPAIIIASLFGVGPGILSVVLSTVAGWYAFLPPYFSWQLSENAFGTLALFVLLGGVNVAVIHLLNVAIDRVLAQERNIRLLIESAPNGILVVDDTGRIRMINRAMEHWFGYGRSEVVGQELEKLVSTAARDRHHALRDAYVAHPVARPMGVGLELKGRRKDGSEFPVEVGLNPVEREGKQAILATVIDISERLKGQERERLLADELHHRVRNLFTVIQGIANRTMNENSNIADAKKAFSGRLMALSGAFGMLATTGFQRAPLNMILEREFSTFSNRLTALGCDVMLNPSAAQQFALIFYELATNAVKYGALSTAAGHVMVKGSRHVQDEEELFTLVWKESGGPPVREPTRKGFGSAMLLQTARQFSENVAMQFPPEGLIYELTVRLRAIEAPKSAKDNEGAERGAA